MFNSSEFYCAFMVVVVIFLKFLIIDYFWNQRQLKNAERPIYASRPSLRFHFKRLMARLLFTLAKRKDIPDDQIDKLQVFDDRDEMVRFLVFHRKLANMKYCTCFSSNNFI